MPLRALLVLVLALALAPLAAAAQEQPARTPRPEGVELYLISPENGAQVKSPVVVRFGLRGMGVAPAGVASPKTGHHHLLIDVDELPPLGQPIPADEHFVHFGGGQTETQIDLPPGDHTLRLLMGDANHVPHDPPVVSDPVTITVVE